MSDQGPTDPTRPERPVGGDPAADEPTTVHRTTETTDTAPRREAVPPEAAGGVSTGLAILAALAVGLIGLLIGYLVFGGDDDDAGDTTTVIEDTAEEEATIAELETERDQLAEQVQDLAGRVEELEAELETVRQERDELQSELEDQPETVAAPSVVGDDVEEARAVAEENGWIFIERPAATPDGAEPGTVVEQYPDPGSPMIEGSVLAVDVEPEPDEPQ